MSDLQGSSRPLFLDFARYCGALLLVGVSTLIALWIAGHWGSAAVEMVYLPAVLAAATWWGFGPSLLAALTSAFAYDFFFTEPIHTFRINSAADIVDVVILLLVALVTSQLAAGIRRQAELAEAHANRNSAIAGFARRLLSCTDEAEIAKSVCEQLSALFVCNALFMTGLPQPRTVASQPIGVPVTTADIAAAVLTLETGKIAGHGSQNLGPAEWLFFPVQAEGGALAAVGLSRDDGQRPVSEEQELLLESLLDQTALALTRARGSAVSHA
jgi:two-component system, OmpR family, sensor histidine kinase KdpD